LDTLTDEELGLLEACWAWRLGGKPLEDEERVQSYLRQAPSRIKIVRALEQLLTAGRLTTRRKNT
jgi:hypothetical protein